MENVIHLSKHRDQDGLHPLPAKHIDCGLGFERLVAVMQNKVSNYDTDIFAPIFNAIEKVELFFMISQRKSYFLSLLYISNYLFFKFQICLESRSAEEHENKSHAKEYFTSSIVLVYMYRAFFIFFRMVQCVHIQERSERTIRMELIWLIAL